MSPVTVASINDSSNNKVMPILNVHVANYASAVMQGPCIPFQSECHYLVYQIRFMQTWNQFAMFLSSILVPCDENDCKNSNQFYGLNLAFFFVGSIFSRCTVVFSQLKRTMRANNPGIS